MLACDVERFHPVLGLENAIAVGIEQIVEELHIELVVFHDQNCFRRRIHRVCLHRGLVRFSRALLGPTSGARHKG